MLQAVPDLFRIERAGLFDQRKRLLCLPRQTLEGCQPGQGGDLFGVSAENFAIEAFRIVQTLFKTVLLGEFAGALEMIGVQSRRLFEKHERRGAVPQLVASKTAAGKRSRVALRRGDPGVVDHRPIGRQRVRRLTQGQSISGDFKFQRNLVRFFRQGRLPRCNGLFVAAQRAMEPRLGAMKGMPVRYGVDPGRQRRNRLFRPPHARQRRSQGRIGVCVGRGEAGGDAIQFSSLGEVATLRRDGAERHQDMEMPRAQLQGSAVGLFGLFHAVTGTQDAAQFQQWPRM